MEEDLLHQVPIDCDSLEEKIRRLAEHEKLCQSIEAELSCELSSTTQCMYEQRHSYQDSRRRHRLELFSLAQRLAQVQLDMEAELQLRREVMFKVDTASCYLSKELQLSNECFSGVRHRDALAVQEEHERLVALDRRLQEQLKAQALSQATIHMACTKIDQTVAAHRELCQAVPGLQESVSHLLRTNNILHSQIQTQITDYKRLLKQFEQTKQDNDQLHVQNLAGSKVKLGQGREVSAESDRLPSSQDPPEVEQLLEQERQLREELANTQETINTLLTQLRSLEEEELVSVHHCIDRAQLLA